MIADTIELNIWLSDNESTTHHFARIFKKASFFDPEITVRRITGNVT